MPATSEPAANPEEVKKVRSAVEDLTAVVAAKRAELQKAEKRLQEAQARLSKLEGKSATFHLRFASPERGLRFEMGNHPGAAKPKGEGEGEMARG